MQLAIWASGIDGTAEGTVQWGGGMVDWEADDYTSNGYYWAELKSITLECADEGLNTTHGYVYTGLDGSNIPVSFSISPTFPPARLVPPLTGGCFSLPREAPSNVLCPFLWSGSGGQLGCRSFHNEL